MGLSGSPAYGRVGHSMRNLFPVHLGGKTRFKGPKNVHKIGEILQSVTFSRVWPTHRKIRYLGGKKFTTFP